MLEEVCVFDERCSERYSFCVYCGFKGNAPDRSDLRLLDNFLERDVLV